MNRALLTGATGLAAFAGGDKVYAVVWNDLRPYSFAYDHVLGTSMELIVDAGRSADAEQANAAALAEIGRLNQILSTYQPGTEINRVRAGAPIESADLASVLLEYETWSARTSGAIDANMAGVIALWMQAAVTGRLPDRSALARAAGEPRAYNIDALGKGYVIEKTVAIARRYAPAGLLNIGGDIRVWGDRNWTIGIADPGNPADNAEPLISVSVREAAITTSGGYARFLSIAGNRYSHLIDPRTQWAAPFGGSATFIARDAVTANALSTTATILGADSAARLSDLGNASGSLVIEPSGTTAATGTLSNAAKPRAIFTAVAPAPSGVEAAAGDWPAGYQVAVAVKLKSQGGDMGGFGGFGGRGPGGPGGRGGAKRPYVAVWVEDTHGKVIKSLTLWASEWKYIPELTTWWSKIRGNQRIAQAISRATRSPGTYVVTWDGRDDAGKPVPTGDYRVFVETNREHGSHAMQTALISCGTAPTEAALKVTSEADASTVTYGPK